MDSERIAERSVLAPETSAERSRAAVGPAVLPGWAQVLASRAASWVLAAGLCPPRVGVSAARAWAGRGGLTVMV